VPLRNRRSPAVKLGWAAGPSKAGWSPEAATALIEHFEHARDRLRASGALDPGAVPARDQALRGMDAWGIDIASDSPLTRQVRDLSAELRRAGRAANRDS
jgi:hypothetical protein